MTDEEKKTIEELKGCRDFWKEQLEKPYISEEDTEMAHKEIKHDTILLNLIKKQSKEIEELNRENTRQHELIGNIHQKWEDKIKAKIEEEDELFFKTKDVRHANRYKAYKELLEKE